MSQKIYCFSANNFKKEMKNNGWETEVPANVAVISIGITQGCSDYYNSSTFDLLNKHWFKNNTDNILNIDFDDIDNETKIVNEYVIKGITDEQAIEIVKFIAKNIDKDFYIHCTAGKSRSKAICQYISDVYKDHEWEDNPENLRNGVWNNFVYGKLIKAYLKEMNI